MASLALSPFTIVDHDGEPPANVDNLDEVTQIVRYSLPGRYPIDKISAEPRRSRKAR